MTVKTTPESIFGFQYRSVPSQETGAARRGQGVHRSPKGPVSFVMAVMAAKAPGGSGAAL